MSYWQLPPPKQPQAFRAEPNVPWQVCLEQRPPMAPVKPERPLPQLQSIEAAIGAGEGDMPTTDLKKLRLI